MKKINWTVAVVLTILAAYGLAGPIKTWSNGERLTAADLNSNFTHIHNEMVGGEGARLVDADVSGSANISYTKIQNGTNLPRAWAAARGCDASACAFAGAGVSSIANPSRGVFDVTLTTAPTDQYFGVTVSAGMVGSAIPSTSNGPWIHCFTSSKQTSAAQFTVRCVDVGFGYASNDGGSIYVQSDFDFAVFDNN